MPARKQLQPFLRQHRLAGLGKEVTAGIPGVGGQIHDVFAACRGKDTGFAEQGQLRQRDVRVAGRIDLPYILPEHLPEHLPEIPAGPLVAHLQIPADPEDLAGRAGDHQRFDAPLQSGLQKSRTVGVVAGQSAHRKGDRYRFLLHDPS